MEKTLDEKCESEITLVWAFRAKNDCPNHLGHSPIELVIVLNLNTPSVLIDQSPALEAAITSKMIGKNLNILYAARKIFIEAESSKKFREL